MTLNQIAQQAMDYLDSVGVAADYEVKYMHIRVITDDHIFVCAYDDSSPVFMSDIAYIYPQKSPA